MSRLRKTSSGTYKMETTGPKVLSRYLSGPTGSVHDNCKCAIKQPTETKPISPFPRRVPKPPVDRTHIEAPTALPRIKQSPSVIPKVTTRNLKNNNVVKDQLLKKNVESEPKKRDLKLKSEKSQSKTYNPPSSRTHRRRHSDMYVPSKTMLLPPTTFPKRRLSEVFIHPNKDLASVSNASMVRGSRTNKNESKKDLKSPLLNNRSNSLKTNVFTPKLNTKVPPLRTDKSLPKMEPKGLRKPKSMKHIKEVVPEKTLHVIEPSIGIEITKTIISPTFASSSEEEVMTHGQNELDASSSLRVDDNNEKDGRLEVPNELLESLPSIDDDTPATDDQLNDNVADSEVNDTTEKTRVGKLVVETSDDDYPDDLRFRRGTILSPRSENNSPRKLEFKKGKELDEDETDNGESKSLRRLSSDGAVYSPESYSISVDLKHQETEEKKDHSGLSNKVIEETANKLIQTRKSKVKALVGAFENIVSGNNQTS
uniref:uncharacterized protein LOC122589472 n=1 Tax=Erigeron canadensis TaxID=72917 RepID=UPI001CB9412E|nr:uncharacterized protein LOC122589472 [Erigeron canadensis]